MIKIKLENVFKELKRKDISKENITVSGELFNVKQLKVVYDLFARNKEMLDYIEVEIKCFLSRREALIVLLEEDFWDKTSYDFTSLKKHEFLASQRFELTNKEKRDLDTPQKVHPKNPCNYYNKDGMGYKKRQYKEAVNKILKTPFYFFEVEIAIETLRAIQINMEANDC